MKSFFILAVLFAFSNVGAMAQNTLHQKHFNLSKGLALGGHDPVSYFAGGRPVKGKPSVKTTSDGVVYYFSSTGNKDLFVKNPEKYKPQYGGWCAYAMGATGEKVEVDPGTFKIMNGKLYLFYNAFFNNTLTDWNKNEVSLKDKADMNWKSIFK